MNVADSSVVIVSVVRNPEMYARCVKDNACVSGCRLVVCDNTKDNIPVPVHYNRVIGSLSPAEDVWFVFCHEDFEFCESIERRLAQLDRSCIYGPCGARRKKYFGVVARWEVSGQITETYKDFSHPHIVGKKRPDGLLLDTLDCMCVIVHSDLLRKYGLRFDERLPFDLYSEDFSAHAFVEAGVRTKLLNIACAHHSTPRVLPPTYYAGLQYLNGKYAGHCFAGTCSYIGGNRLAKHLCGPFYGLVKSVKEMSFGARLSRHADG